MPIDDLTALGQKMWETRKNKELTQQAMSLTLAKAEIVIIINYDSCFFTFDMGILIPCFYYSYLFS
jgi:hypothetical protein